MLVRLRCSFRCASRPFSCAVPLAPAGKTLIARQIGKILATKEPKVVNGPEILNKFVGASEENIRNLFKEAEEDTIANGDNAELHIIIFDEIDASQTNRATEQGSGVQARVLFSNAMWVSCFCLLVCLLSLQGSRSRR